MNLFRPIVLCLLCCAAGVLIAGCGGGDSTSSSSADTGSSNSSTSSPGTTSGDASTSTAPLTKVAFIKQGDAICKKMDKTQNAAMNAYAAKHPKSSSTKTGREKIITEAGLQPIQVEAEELEALGAPSGDEQTLEEIVALLEKAIVKAESNPGAANATGPENPFFKADELAAQYGFKVCNFLY